MNKSNKIVVGISVGDLNGIGTEVLLKTFEDKRMLDFCTPVIFASVKLLSYFKRKYNLSLNLHGIDNPKQIIHKKINVLNVWKETVDIQFGEESKKIGEYAIRSLKAATTALKNSDIDVLVTAPINKHTIQSETFSFPGHTDYLAKELHGDSMMLMISDTLRVGLLTDHVPVKDVSEKITAKLIEDKVQTLHKTLKQDFGILKPKIAILGINPHTGDNGVIGKEDDDIVRPTLKKLIETGMVVYGPYPADSFFGSGNYKNFDAILAAYHDQGLVPFKTLSFGEGVNFTAGLNKIRTSPDHGTAYDIAGKNEANNESFKEAVFAAIKIYKTRTEYLEISKAPLKKHKNKPFKKVQINKQ